MAISSINIKASSSNAFTHNDRTLSPSYLLDQKDSLGIECNRSANEARELYLSLRNEAFGNYTLRTGQKVQTKEEKLRWSAVVNLNENHTLKDVENLANTLSKKYGWQVLQVAVHRDEGFVKDDKPHYNLHAHIEFFMLNKEGVFTFKKRDFGTKKMSELQDVVSSELSMQRGTPKLESKRERLEHREYKQQARAIEHAVEKVKETYNFREYQQRITALDVENNDLKKELHKLNTAVNKGKATVQELEAKISALSLRVESREKTLLEILPTAQKPIEVVHYVQELKKDLSQALQSKNELEAVNHTLKSEKMDFRATESNLNAQVQELKNENEVLKKENEKLSWYKQQYQNIVSSLKKWTNLEDIRAVMQSVKDKFQEPKAHIESVEEFERGLPLRSIHTATDKIRQELEASNEPEYLKIAKGLVLDEFEKQRLEAVMPNTRVTLDDILLAEQGYKEFVASQKKQDQGLER